MSMHRAIARNIARERMIDSGIDRPNKRMSRTGQGGERHGEMLDKAHRGRKNSRRKKAFLEMMRRKDPPVWKRIVCGDLADDAVKAWKKASFRRGLANQERKVHRGEKWHQAG